MGAWGPGLYQDDTTCDIKEEYLNLLRVGYTNIDATNYLIENSFELEDEELAPLFWFALADTQYKYGRLLPEVKDIAIKYIDSENDLERWKDAEKQYDKRKEVLKKLKEKLNSPQPSEKKVTKLTMRRAYWNPGDILLHQITSEELKEHKWYNKYALIKVLGLSRYNIGGLPRDTYYHEHNIAVIFDWIGDKEPGMDTIDKLNVYEASDIENISWFNKVLFSSNSRETKKMNMKLLYNSSNIDNNISLMSGLNIGWESTARGLDETIIIALEKSEKRGTLIDEIDK